MNGDSKGLWADSRAHDAVQPEQNGLVERFSRSRKEERIWLHRLKSMGQARVTISRSIRRYNEGQPRQSLGYVAPLAHPALAA
ncbi:transposase [Halomonas desiderata]|uniref:integrase core domain-containing protein n=1 Tax=Billgrantia desiderata TaxID=52021 RepID=UPI00174D4762|nr:transposase [Halomonas desiderata]